LVLLVLVMLSGLVLVVVRPLVVPGFRLG